jgi:hypothetical protein
LKNPNPHRETNARRCDLCHSNSVKLLRTPQGRIDGSLMNYDWEEYRQETATAYSSHRLLICAEETRITAIDTTHDGRQPGRDSNVVPSNAESMKWSSRNSGRQTEAFRCLPQALQAKYRGVPLVNALIKQSAMFITCSGCMNTGGTVGIRVTVRQSVM